MTTKPPTRAASVLSGRREDPRTGGLLDDDPAQLTPWAVQSVGDACRPCSIGSERRGGHGFGAIAVAVHGDTAVFTMVSRNGCSPAAGDSEPVAIAKARRPSYALHEPHLAEYAA